MTGAAGACRTAIALTFLFDSLTVAADVGDSAQQVGEAMVYGIPAIGAALTIAANGTALAVGEPSPYGWRVAGWTAGGVELAVGATWIIARGDRNNFELALGVVAASLGVVALATATFVATEERLGVVLVPTFGPDGAGAAVGARF